MLGTEIQHLLHLGNAAGQGAGQRMATEDQCAAMDRRWYMRQPDQDHHAVAPEHLPIDVEIVRRRYGVEDPALCCAHDRVITIPYSASVALRTGKSR